MKSKEERRKRGSGTLFLRNGHYVFKYYDAGIGRNRKITLHDELGHVVTDKILAEQLIVNIEKDAVRLSAFESKAEYMTKVAEVRHIIHRCRVTVGEMMKAYFDHPLALDGQARAKTSAIKFVQAHYPAEKLLCDFTEEDAVMIMALYWKTGISAKSYNERLQCMKIIFRTFLKEDSPFRELKQKSFVSERREAFSLTQLEAIWKTLSDPSFHLYAKEEMKVLYILALYTGARLGDLCLLKKRSVNMQERKITFTPKKTSLSSGLKVEIPMATPVYDALLPIMSLNSKTEFVLPVVADRYKRNAPGLTRDTARLLERAGIQTKEEPDGIRRLVKVTKYSFHSFRHTLASLAINQGANIRIVQNLLGHTNANMTSHYAHISMQSKQQVLNMLPVFSLIPDPQQFVQQPSSFAEVFTALDREHLLAVGRWLEDNLTLEQRNGLMQILH